MSEWFKEKPTCVVLCGGRGSRLFPLSLQQQKSMIEIGGKPVLKHIIDYWGQYTDKFVFVVKHQKEGIINFIKTLSIKAEFIEPSEVKGLADAISYVKNSVGEKFFVVLGDCVCKGRFQFPENFEQGIGVCETDKKEDIARSYSVETGEKEIIKMVVEKPQIIPNKLCGMGFYFFTRKIFDYIEQKSSETDDLTNVIQAMIEGGERIHPISFDGHYLNITYPNDLERAKEILKD